MRSLKLNDDRSSINHAELWGKTEGGECFYLRFRAGTLVIRTAEEFDGQEGRYISETKARTQYKRRYKQDHYQDVKREFEDWNELLMDTPYIFEETPSF